MLETRVILCPHIMSLVDAQSCRRVCICVAAASSSQVSTVVCQVQSNALVELVEYSWISPFDGLST